MPSKKKKFNARFPPARIKKIMQTDEDVGKVAAAVPVIISRSLELFIESFIQKTATITKGRNAKTLSATHIKQTIHSEKTFDFLRDLVTNVPDHQPEEDGDSNASFASCSTAQEVKKPKVQRPRKEKTGNGRGRPRKKDPVKEETEEMEKEDTESEVEGSEGSDSDSPANTEQFETSTDDSSTQPSFMQQTPQQPNSKETDSGSDSGGQTSSAFQSPPGLSSIMPASLLQHNRTSPRPPMLQSPPQFSDVSMMPPPQFQNLPHAQLQNIPYPHLQNIPHPQLQNIPSQMFPPQQFGFTNQIPPPPSLQNFSNHLPVPPNFYPPHISQLPQYPTISSHGTFTSDQKPSLSSSQETHPAVSHFNPSFKPGEVNLVNSYMNNPQNNEPLDMSKSSQRKRSPNSKQETLPKKSKTQSLHSGLPNIMDMTAPKQVTDDDDDYDT